MSIHKRFFGLDRDIAQLEFNKTIAGCYRDGNAEYDSVGVLLLTWREDDMNCKEKEVNDLENLLKDKFRFKTEQYEIPPTESDQSLFNRLKAFNRCYDSPSKLGIIYYGGHADRRETHDGVDLELFARRSANEVAIRSISRSSTTLSDISLPESPTDTKGDTNVLNAGPRPDQSYISFKAICDQIKTSETDILLVIDSCFAAGAFTDQPFGGRKCELFCSIAEKDWARAPGQEGSFTKILTSTMAKMIAENPEGFSTSDLYRQVYQRQHQAHKPFHFTQSRFDFGRIWIRPCRQEDKSSTPFDDSKYTVDVRFHLTKSVDLMELNKMAKALQWIPYVQTVKLQNMHSPSDDLIKFIRKVYIANRLRPALTRIRRKLELERAQQLRRTDSSSSSSSLATREPFPVQQPRNVGLFDWSKTKAVMPRNERLTSDQYIDPERIVRRKYSDPQTSTTPVEQDMADAALQLMSRKSSIDESGKTENTPVQHLTSMRLSQRNVERLLIFAMGVLAPRIIGWAVQGSASPFATP